MSASAKLWERHVKIDTQCCSFGQYVANLGFELGVESSAAELENVLVCQLLKQQKSGRFPDEPAKIKFAQAHSGRRPEVLATAGMKEIELEGRLL